MKYISDVSDNVTRDLLVDAIREAITEALDNTSHPDLVQALTGAED